MLFNVRDKGSTGAAPLTLENGSEGLQRLWPVEPHIREQHDARLCEPREVLGQGRPLRIAERAATEKVEVVSSGQRLLLGGGTSTG